MGQSVSLAAVSLAPSDRERLTWAVHRQPLRDHLWHSNAPPQPCVRLGVNRNPSNRVRSKNGSGFLRLKEQRRIRLLDLIDDPREVTGICGNNSGFFLLRTHSTGSDTCG